VFDNYIAVATLAEAGVSLILHDYKGATNDVPQDGNVINLEASNVSNFRNPVFYCCNIKIVV
jgi:hypothetical protein